MAIRCCKHERLAGPRVEDVDPVSEFLGDDAIELGGQDLPVEVVDGEVEAVVERRQVDLAGPCVERLYRLAGLERNPGLGERGVDQVGRIMVNQPPVYHGIAIAVAIDRLAEDLGVCSAGVAVSPTFTASKYSTTRRYLET